MDTCILCGWDITKPYRGRTIGPDGIIELTLGGAPAGERRLAVHAVCLLRDGVSLADKIAAAAGLRTPEGEVTDTGRAILATGRVA